MGSGVRAAKLSIPICIGTGGIELLQRVLWFDAVVGGEDSVGLLDKIWAWSVYGKFSARN